jgi:hypothetical protein
MLKRKNNTICLDQHLEIHFDDELDDLHILINDFDDLRICFDDHDDHHPSHQVLILKIYFDDDECDDLLLEELKQDKNLRNQRV